MRTLDKAKHKSAQTLLVGYKMLQFQRQRIFKTAVFLTTCNTRCLEELYCRTTILHAYAWCYQVAHAKKKSTFVVNVEPTSLNQQPYVSDLWPILFVFFISNIFFLKQDATCTSIRQWNGRRALEPFCYETYVPSATPQIASSALCQTMFLHELLQTFTASSGYKPRKTNVIVANDHTSTTSSVARGWDGGGSKHPNRPTSTVFAKQEKSRIKPFCVNFTCGLGDSFLFTIINLFLISRKFQLWVFKSI